MTPFSWILMVLWTIGGGKPSVGEIPTLAIPSRLPRWRSERDFRRFADACLRGYLPTLVTHGQFNRRALGSELQDFQRQLAAGLAQPREVHHALDAALIPAVARVCLKIVVASGGRVAFLAGKRFPQ